MTKSEYNIARRRFQWELSWMGVAWMALWMGAFLGVGGECRYWFHDHKIVSYLFIVIAVLGFVVPMYFLSRFLHRKHRMICPKCSHWLVNAPSVAETGRCPECEAEICPDP